VLDRQAPCCYSHGWFQQTLRLTGQSFHWSSGRAAQVHVSKSRVLVVDDDPDVRSFLSAFLELEGYEVQTAANGAEALHSVAEQRPDVILLDLMMPVMDGWTFCRQLAMNHHTSHPPIIIISASHELDGRLQEAGASAFIAKPFDLDCLLSCLREQGSAAVAR